MVVGQKLYAQLSSSLNQINAAANRSRIGGGQMPMSAAELMSPGINTLAETLSQPTHGLYSSPVPSASTSPSPMIHGGVASATSMPVTVAPVPSSTSTSTFGDTDSLQDILMCSGIDLKEEAENILREQDSLFAQHAVSPSGGEDVMSKAPSLLNVEGLSFLISAIAGKYRLTNAKTLDPLLLDTILLVLQAKFASLIDEMVIISRHRIDFLRSSFKTRTDNDPRRQLFVLERALILERQLQRESFDQGTKNIKIHKY